MLDIQPPTYETDLTSLGAQEAFQKAPIPPKTRNIDTLANGLATLIIFGGIAAIAIHASSITPLTTSGIIGITGTLVTASGAIFIITWIVRRQESGTFHGQQHWKPLLLTEKQPYWMTTLNLSSDVFPNAIGEHTKLEAWFKKEHKQELSTEEYAHLYAELAARHGTNYPQLAKRRDIFLQQSFANYGYLDMSTSATGKCSIYHYKNDADAKAVATLIMLATPLHIIGKMVAAAVRFLILPAKMAFEGRTIREIGYEMGRNLLRIVQAPFYGVAVIFAALYMWIDKLNGMKLIAAIEGEWNEHIPLRKSGWAVVLFSGFCASLCCQPSHLVKGITDWVDKARAGGGFYVAGCCQPHVTAELNTNHTTIMRTSGYPHFYHPKNKEKVEYYPYFRMDTASERGR